MKKNKDSKKKKLSKKAKRNIIVLSVIGAVVIYFVVSSQVKAAQPMTVMTVSAEIGDIEQTLSTSGTVESELVKTYYSPVGATIASVDAKLGENVSAGQLLVGYDVTDLETAKQQAELRTEVAVNNYLGTAAQSTQSGGKYAEASTSLEILEEQIEDQKAVVKELKDRLEARENELQNKYAKRDLELQKKLQTEEANAYSATGTDAKEQIQWRIRGINNEISQNNYEKSMISQDLEMKAIQNGIDEAEKVLAKYEETRTEMKTQKSGNESKVSDTYSAKGLNASANETKISEQVAVNNLEKAQSGIVADFDGIVTDLSVKEGALATQGMQLLEIQSNKKVCVEFDITRYDLEKVAIGQKADVTIAGKKYEGEVSKINHMATKNEAGSSVVQAQIHINNPDENIYLGIEAKIILYTKSNSQTLVVPNEVINADMNGDFVFVVENGCIVKRPVVVGISAAMNSEILEGLSTEDRIVLDGSYVTEGMTVMELPQDASVENVAEVDTEAVSE